MNKTYFIILFSIYNLSFGLAQNPTLLKGELSLEDCIQLALKQSPDLKKAQLALERSKLSTAIARGAFDLKIDLDSSLTVKEDTFTNRLSINQPTTYGITLTGSLSSTDLKGSEDLGSYSLGLSKAILGQGLHLETRNSLDDSLIDDAIEMNNLKKTTRRRILQVTRSFYGIIRDKQTLKIQELRLIRAKKNLERAHVRENLNDIFTARLEVPERELDILRAESSIETALDELKVIIGIPVSHSIDISTSFSYQVQSIELDEDLSWCLTNHEDVLNLQLNRKKLLLDQKIAHHKTLPNVNLSYRFNKNSTNGLRFPADDEQTVSVDMSWWPRRRTQLAREQNINISLEDNRYDIFILSQQKAREIRRLDRRLKELEKSVERQKERVQLGEQQKDRFEERWNDGEIDILEYLRAQNNLENDNVQLINLKISYLETLAAYQFEIGG